MAKAEQIMKLSEVLLSAERLLWQLELFLPADRRWTEDTQGALLDTEDEEDPDNPEFAKAHSLVCTLGMSQVQEIISNARQQELNADIGKLLRAFLFYYENDAFIDFDNP
ncbi:MAG: hypothetical protein JO250_05515 [Armatimonadetes bacterium]|nr:hypothetical protein [Armatimonadota bacterium]